MGWNNGSYERIHLTHVTTEPEKPAASPREHENNLKNSSVRSFRNQKGENDPHSSPQNGEE
jgi:hypothetical protein